MATSREFEGMLCIDLFVGFSVEFARCRFVAGFKENSHSRSTSPPCQVDNLFEFRWLLLIVAAP